MRTKKSDWTGIGVKIDEVPSEQITASDYFWISGKYKSNKVVSGLFLI